MRILVDQDEVLCKWVDRILLWYNIDKRKEAQDRGEQWEDVQISDISCWDMKTNLGPASEVYIRSYMRYPNFYADLEPIPGAISGMEKLLANHDVLVTTAVPKCAGLAYEGKKEWLRKHIPSFPLNNLCGISRKDILDGDILFDDGLHNIIPFWKKGKDVVVMDRPWNRNFPEEKEMKLSGRFFRVSTWEEFVRLVEALEVVIND